MTGDPGEGRDLDIGGLLEALAPYEPAIVGSVPLGVQRADSDLDIACRAMDLDGFDAHIAAHAGDAVLVRWRRRSAPPASVVRLRVSGLTVEVFAQPLPVARQQASRHMLIEGRLLRLLGDPLRAEVLRLTHDGLGTEAAFARAIGLDAADPFAALLELEGLSDAQLRRRARGRTPTTP